MNPVPDNCPNDGICIPQSVELEVERRRRDWTKVWLSIAMPILAALIGWIFIDQRNQEHRLTKVEERVEGIKEDLTEIKHDVKKLLGESRR